MYDSSCSRCGRCNRQVRSDTFFLPLQCVVHTHTGMVYGDLDGIQQGATILSTSCYRGAQVKV